MKSLFSLTGVLWMAMGISANAAELLLAHRGVYQNYSRKNLDNTTCTADRILKSTHSFLENTIPSIAEAFRLGADIVEIDVHASRDGHVVVFHDWTLECRTNGKGITEEQSLTYLRSLDIGYGYTHDNHKTYPFRCVPQHPDYQACLKRNRMPTLEEVLVRFPNKRFAVNPKSASERSLKTVLSELQRVNQKHGFDLSQIFWFSGSQKILDRARQILPKMNIPKLGKQAIKKCLKGYMMSGAFAPICYGAMFGLPYSKFKAMGESHAQRIVQDIEKIDGQLVIYRVNTESAYRYVSKFKVAGILTDKIEVIGKVSGAATDMKSHSHFPKEDRP